MPIGWFTEVTEREPPHLHDILQFAPILDAELSPMKAWPVLLACRPPPELLGYNGRGTASLLKYVAMT